ncbi:hypothetical protein WAI453_012418 [Rhynchosporium graminicola]
MNFHASGKTEDTFLWTACLPLQTLHSASPRELITSSHRLSPIEVLLLGSPLMDMWSWSISPPLSPMSAPLHPLFDCFRGLGLTNCCRLYHPQLGLLAVSYRSSHDAGRIGRDLRAKAPWTAWKPDHYLSRCPLLLDTDSLDAAEASFEMLDGPFGSAESAGNPSRFAVVHPFLCLILLPRILARSRIFGSYLGIGPRQLLRASDTIMRHVLISRYGR